MTSRSFPRGVVVGLVCTLAVVSHAAAQDSVTIALSSRQLWRGYDFGGGVSLESQLDIGLLGHARSTLGWFGVRGEAGAAIPLQRRTERRRNGEQYQAGANGYACLNGSSCTWAVELGFAGILRPHAPGDVNTSAEVVGTIRGQKIFQAKGVRLVPDLVVRRDLHAFDAWMMEAGLANIAGRGPTKAALSARLRLSNYGAWGEPTRALGFHDLEFTAGLRQARMFTDSWLVSWTWLVEGGLSVARDAVGPTTGVARAGLSLIR